MNIIVFFLFNQ